MNYVWSDLILHGHFYRTDCTCTVQTVIVLSELLDNYNISVYIPFRPGQAILQFPIFSISIKFGMEGLLWTLSGYLTSICIDAMLLLLLCTKLKSNFRQLTSMFQM
jgi:hypothetical protein